MCDIAVGIVGSRTFSNWKMVKTYVDGLPKDWRIFSGGARGADTFAAFYGRLRGMCVVELIADVSDCVSRSDFVRKLQSRNQAIVNNVDMLVAFVDKRTGGSWDSVRRAEAKGIDVVVYDEQGCMIHWCIDGRRPGEMRFL